MQKDSNRPRRIAELLRRELAQLIPRELHHPLAHRITLTHAEMSRDLSSVKIYFTLLGAAVATAPAAAAGVAPPAPSRDSKDATKALNHAAGFLRHALHGRVVLRTIPELRFHFDEVVERGARLTSLIDRAVAEDKKEPPHDD